jgi:hypothetical protein
MIAARRSAALAARPDSGFDATVRDAAILDGLVAATVPASAERVVRPAFGLDLDVLMEKV